MGGSDGLSDAAFFRALVDAGGVTAGAATMASSPSSVSRRLAALERRLGVRLAERSAKRFTLTDEGELYYSRSAELLALLRDTEAEVSARGAVARGRLRLGAPVDFGRMHVAPLLAQFAAEHPGLEAHLVLSDGGLEVGQDALDVALRIGLPHEAGTVARRLAACPTLVCASPAYIARHGAPQSPEDLRRHQCLRLARKHRLIDVWHFQSGQGPHEVSVEGRLSSDSGEVLRQWAVEGHGVSREARWDVARDLREGRLVQCLADTPGEDVELYVVFAPGRPTPPRIRLLVDFLVAALPKRLAHGLAGSEPTQANGGAAGRG